MVALSSTAETDHNNLMRLAQLGFSPRGFFNDTIKPKSLTINFKLKTRSCSFKPRPSQGFNPATHVFDLLETESSSDPEADDDLDTVNSLCIQYKLVTATSVLSFQHDFTTLSTLPQMCLLEHSSFFISCMPSLDPDCRILISQSDSVFLNVYHHKQWTYQVINTAPLRLSAQHHLLGSALLQTQGGYLCVPMCRRRDEVLSLCRLSHRCVKQSVSVTQLLLALEFSEKIVVQRCIRLNMPLASLSAILVSCRHQVVSSTSFSSHIQLSPAI